MSDESLGVKVVKEMFSVTTVKKTSSATLILVIPVLQREKNQAEKYRGNFSKTESLRLSLLNNSFLTMLALGVWELICL